MFIPKRVIFEKGTLNSITGKEIYEYFSKKEDIEIIMLQSNRMKENIPGENLFEQYREGKKTLVVGIKRRGKFQSCKPSAHFQLPLVTGCMGQCEYCYLNTNLGDKPFVKVYVNVEEILGQAKEYISQRIPEVTIFEGAATSDPIPVEPYTHGLEKAIGFFGQEKEARFRFVTKYNNVDSLLSLEHNGHTEIRFSLNTNTVIHQYEHATASLEKRMDASMKTMKAGYPTGYLLAPVFIYPGWKEEYRHLLKQIKEKLPEKLPYPLTFEVISHRYTAIAKNRIKEIFPITKLPMEENERTFRYGQFGYGKYVYPKESLGEMKEFFQKEIEDMFSNNEIKYII